MSMNKNHLCNSSYATGFRAGLKMTTAFAFAHSNSLNFTAEVAATV